MKIAFIGGGNMGRAMVAAILNKSLCKPSDITVADKDPARLAQLEKDFGVRTITDNLEAISSAEVIILAIKPQNLDEAMPGLRGRLKYGQLVLSIIAGKNLATLKTGLGHDVIVRAMPNTPAQIGRGMTVWTATASTSETQKNAVRSILGSMGEEIFVGDERYIDMATAVSGSGPAYVFLFMESLLEAAVKIGLPPEEARRLVLQTVTGASLFAAQSDKSLAELRRMVTSPGGTTAEALKVLEAGGFGKLIEQAVIAAYEKAKQLGIGNR